MMVLPLTRMVEFEFLSLQVIIQETIDPDFDFFRLIGMIEFPKNSIVGRLNHYVLILIQLAIVILILFIFMLLLRNVKHKILALLKKIFKKIFWNGFIRANSIAFVASCIAATEQINRYKKGDLNQETYDIVMGFVILILMSMAPLATFVIIKRFRNKLHIEDVRNSISNLYTGIRVQQAGTKIYYKVIFIAKRLLFVLIPTELIKDPAIQLQVLMAVNLVYFSCYLHLFPHLTKLRRTLEVTNEVLMMLVLYHYVTFSSFNLSLDAKYTMGYSFQVVLGVLIIVNIGTMILKQVLEQIQKHRIKRILKQRMIDQFKRENKPFGLKQNIIFHFRNTK